MEQPPLGKGSAGKFILSGVAGFSSFWGMTSQNPFQIMVWAMAQRLLKETRK